MTDATFQMRKKISFAIANGSALLLVVGICARLARRWSDTSGLFHFWVLFTVADFAMLWLTLLRGKNERLSWSDLLSLSFAVLVLLGAEGILSS